MSSRSSVQANVTMRSAWVLSARATISGSRKGLARSAITAGIADR